MSTSGRGPDRHGDGDGFDPDFERWGELIQKAVDQGTLSEFFEAIEDILAMDPEARFTESAKRLHDVFSDDETTIREAIEGQEGTPISREMYQAFDEVWQVAQRVALKQLQRTREKEVEHLLVGIYLEKAKEAFVEVDRRIDEGDDLVSALSIFIALNSRLMGLALNDEPSDEIEMYRDVLRADFYMSNKNEALDPERLSDEEVRDTVLLEAAILAYDRLEISVSRGAELAGVSRQAFEEALIDHDIEIQSGPEHLDEYVAESSLFSDE